MNIKLIITLMLLACSSLKAQYTQKNLKLENPVTANQYQYKNLQLYPIRANDQFKSQHKNLGNYLTLKEGLENKKVLITEYQNGRSGAEVNTLYIENVATDTILILAGEVVQGGKQDRMIAQDIMLYPRSGKKPVSVFCVEHGRWQARKDDMSFNQYYTISSNEVRKAGTVNKNQQEVWNKVSEATSKNKAQTTTGTLTALHDSESFSKEMKQYNDHFDKLFLTQPDVIGVVAVSGNVILGCDMFATNDLFKKHYVNLIHSFAAEAITSGRPGEVSYGKVNEYLQNIIADEKKQDEEVQKKGTVLKDGNRKIHISTF